MNKLDFYNFFVEIQGSLGQTAYLSKDIAQALNAMTKRIEPDEVPTQVMYGVQKRDVHYDYLQDGEEFHIVYYTKEYAQEVLELIVDTYDAEQDLSRALYKHRNELPSLQLPDKVIAFERDIPLSELHHKEFKNIFGFNAYPAKKEIDDAYKLHGEWDF